MRDICYLPFGRHSRRTPLVQASGQRSSRTAVFMADFDEKRHHSWKGLWLEVGNPPRPPQRDPCLKTRRAPCADDSFHQIGAERHCCNANGRHCTHLSTTGLEREEGRRLGLRFSTVVGGMASERARQNGSDKRTPSMFAQHCPACSWH